MYFLIGKYNSSWTQVLQKLKLILENWPVKSNFPYRQLITCVQEDTFFKLPSTVIEENNSLT